MPIYTYVCRSENMDCYNIKVELLRSIKDIDELPKCEHCQSPMERLLTQTDFRMKPFTKD